MLPCPKPPWAIVSGSRYRDMERLAVSAVRLSRSRCCGCAAAHAVDAASAFGLPFGNCPVVPYQGGGGAQQTHTLLFVSAGFRLPTRLHPPAKMRHLRYRVIITILPDNGHRHNREYCDRRPCDGVMSIVHYPIMPCALVGIAHHVASTLRVQLGKEEPEGALSSQDLEAVAVEFHDQTHPTRAPLMGFVLRGLTLQRGILKPRPGGGAGR
ncbi:hypothetical protein B0T18DRAFT_410265 [Schizothecium vesticola]|uniref:Uncharacterized protein n=1 Tax=Schizothecium vesticola TaxID=314040 RepID=A0AA40EUW3_9PEZI|nr:hypothetical protein B0T18DRAFT_410265 [Schizothecium vesticola]